jgi:acetyltransferase-like isoleucine patch superfamily enzyme/dTDP-4-dehydrorhamnose 3,5-epimerase-like enzyme
MPNPKLVTEEFPMSFFLHPQGICESTNVGERTRIWAFAHVLPGAVIGTDCNICDGVFVENDVTIGNSVTVKCGVQVWDGVTLEDNVFIGPNATFTNDLFPRSQEYPEQFLRTLVKRGASIGANSTILPGLTIGTKSMVGAGSVVTRDVPDFAIVAGNPARITGYVDTMHPMSKHENIQKGQEFGKSQVRGVKLFQLSQAIDLRGSLVAGEVDKDLPFQPKRFFTVFNVPSSEARGSHAHKLCEQFLVCLHGSVRAIVDDGYSKEEFLLDRPEIGLYMPARTWGTQYQYSRDAVLLVIDSHPYDSEDYIRDYAEFIALVNSDGN